MKIPIEPHLMKATKIEPSDSKTWFTKPSYILGPRFSPPDALYPKPAKSAKLQTAKPQIEQKPDIIKDYLFLADAWRSLNRNNPHGRKF